MDDGSGGRRTQDVRHQGRESPDTAESLMKAPTQQSARRRGRWSICLARRGWRGTSGGSATGGVGARSRTWCGRRLGERTERHRPASGLHDEGLIRVRANGYHWTAAQVTFADIADGCPSPKWSRTPPTPPERMPWGEERIAAELKFKLGLGVSPRDGQAVHAPAVRKMRSPAGSG
jgi:hypothetical protein